MHLFLIHTSHARDATRRRLVHRRDRLLEERLLLALVFMLSLCASSMHSMHLLVITFPCAQSPHPLQSLQRRRSLPCLQIPLPPIPSAAQSLQKYPCRSCGQSDLGHRLHVFFWHRARVVPCGHFSCPTHFLHVSLNRLCSHASPPLHRTHLMIGMSCSQYPAARHRAQLYFHLPCGQQLHSLHAHWGSTPCSHGPNDGVLRAKTVHASGIDDPGLRIPGRFAAGFADGGVGFFADVGAGFFAGVGLALGFLAPRSPGAVALDANFLAARDWTGGRGSGAAVGVEAAEGLVVGGLAFDANFLAAPGEARACGRSLTVRGLLE